MSGRPARVPRLGPRGEGWVLLQSVLVAGAVVAGLAGGWPGYLRVPAVALAVAAGAAGLWLAAAAVTTLGRSLSPFPKPPAASRLKESGAYARVRHPIYGGLLLLCLAWSLLTGPWALLPTAGLAAVLLLKSRLEERWLLERHPAYAAYRERVRRRFIPHLW